MTINFYTYKFGEIFREYDLQILLKNVNLLAYEVKYFIFINKYRNFIFAALLK